MKTLKSDSMLVLLQIIIKLIALSMLLCFCFHATQAQYTFTNNHNNQFQYGIAAKLQVILNDNKGGGDGIPTIRLALNGGLAVVLNVPLANGKLMPAYNHEILMYYNGVGSSKYHRLHIDFNNSFTTTFALYNKDHTINYDYIEDNNTPLYYFSNNVNPALVNPFNYTLTLGYNYISSKTKSKYSQRVGFFGLKANRFQLAYYNDGGFGLNLLGDRKDRNYTGGLLLGVGLKREYNLNNIEVHYIKYTGYSPNNFEISSALSLSYSDYTDTTQQYYNRSKWSITCIGLKNRLSLNYDFNNYLGSDLQHFIHKFLYDPFHVVPLKASKAFGISGLYNINSFNP